MRPSFLHKMARAKTFIENFWLVHAVQDWLKADGLRMSAAMSFYAMLSLAPLLILIVAMLGWWLDRSVIESSVIAQVQAIAGDRTAALIEQALQSASTKSQGIFASLIAFGILLSAATGVFVALQDSLKTIWGSSTEDSKKPVWSMLMLRLRGVGYMLIFGGLLILSLIASTVLRFMDAHWHDLIAIPLFWAALTEGVSFVFIALMFCGMMRISDGQKPSLRYLAVGAAIGAALFAVGRHFMTAYLAGAAAVSAYGAAGSLVALLMWIYFTSAILLLSASCAKALAQSKEVASKIAPDSPVTPSAPNEATSTEGGLTPSNAIAPKQERL